VAGASSTGVVLLCVHEGARSGEQGSGAQEAGRPAAIFGDEGHRDQAAVIPDDEQRAGRPVELHRRVDQAQEL